MWRSSLELIECVRCQRKYSVPVTLALLAHRIVPVVEFDAQMSRLILRDFKPSLMDFMAEFLGAVVQAEPAVVPIGLMRHSIQALGQAEQLGRASSA